MISLVLLSQNIKEQQILNMALTQQGVKVLLSEPSYQNFVFIMQYMPDLIIIELPHVCIEQLNFTSRIRSYKRTRLLPIIGYGNRVDASLKRGIQKNGVTTYLERPLKYSDLLRLIERLLKPFGKTLEKKPEITEKEQDLALILNPETLPVQKIEAMCRHISKLCAFPFTIAKVLQITNSEKSGATDLAKAISADPAISTHLLKISNSVFFASSNRRISSIKEAIIRIGFEETKKITMGMSVINLFTQTNKNLGFDRTDFWYHSLTVAFIAERIARSMADVNTEEAFLAGLLHDLGILLLDEFFPTVFNDILEHTTKNAGRFHDTAKERLNITHLDIIGDLFPRWKMPQQITDAITGQYLAAGFDHKPDTINEKLAVCIALGDLFAKLMHSGRECDEFVPPVDNALMQAAKLPFGISRSFLDGIRSQVVLSRSFFGLEERDYGSERPDDIDPKLLKVGVFNPDQSILIPPAVNLTCHGIQCETIAAVKPDHSLDGKYHAVLCWFRKPADPSRITPLRQLQQAPYGDNTSVSNVPVLIFSPENSVPEQFAGCTVFGNSIDLRLLESGLAEMLSATFARNPVAGAA